VIKKYAPPPAFDEKPQKMQIPIENHESPYNQLLPKPSMGGILMNNELSLKAKFENLASQQSRHPKITPGGAPMISRTTWTLGDSENPPPRGY